MSYRSIVVCVVSCLAACGDNNPGGGPDAARPPDAGVPDAPPGPEAGAWQARFALPGLSGTIARVEDLVRGPDGRIYAGGMFTDAAGVAVDNIAAWDGTTWHALGAAPGEWVRSLVFDSGTLWA